MMLMKQRFLYAEIKAIATGNPLIKEKMDLDVRLERIRLTKFEFLRSHEQLLHKISRVYPNRVQESKNLLAKIQANIEIVQKNTVVDENGQEKFSITLNGKTFTDKKEASGFIADLLKKNSGSKFPLRGLSGEYKGLHISITSIVSLKWRLDLINTLKDTQAKIDNLLEKIETSKTELQTPFQMQAEFDQLSLRSAELTHLLNEDANSSVKRQGKYHFRKTAKDERHF